ncbi:MAG: polymer-forming cytoskeletal protein [Patescibacteria group bacterium]|jgi:cytoskeletal protein CcmA (bactofilin family)|nr:polymer-forming cytoskeletal protein [Patescibacteria group bacterium]
MFKKEPHDEIETIIGPSVQVEGNFVASGDVIIEGTVSGSVKTDRNLTIGKDAKIFADISAANALIAGEVQGDVKIQDSLQLTETAKIFGDVKTRIITISSGASLNGKCTAGEANKSKFEKIDERVKLEKAKNKSRETEETELNK